MSDKEIVLKEFLKLADDLSKPRGFMKVVNYVSSWFSLNVTVLIQALGLQRSITRGSSEPLILNIGSGDQFPVECINTDLFPTFGSLFKIITGRESVKFDYFLNVVYGDRNLNGVADGIILSHVLEHIPAKLSLTVLKNLRSFLTYDGVLRISVPVLKAYDKNPIPLDQGITTRSIAQNSLFYRWNHQFMYDQELLTILLETAGFKNIHVKCSFFRLVFTKRVAP